MAIFVSIKNHLMTQTVVFDNDNAAKAFMFDAITEENAECFLEDCVTVKRRGRVKQCEVYTLLVDRLYTDEEIEQY